MDRNDNAIKIAENIFDKRAGHDIERRNATIQAIKNSQISNDTIVNDIIKFATSFQNHDFNSLDLHGNTRHFEIVDAPNLSDELFNTQTSVDEVNNILDQNNLREKITFIQSDIEKEKLNLGMYVHGQRHAGNVVLFSGLIGQQLGLNERGMNLLLISAKYHDCGRDKDGNYEHARQSAEQATSKLLETMSHEEIAIIKTIIEFHEIDRTIENVDEIFTNIATANGIQESQIQDIRAIAEILKDADALDRTRFEKQGARTNVDFLHYPQAKQLLKYSAQLAETQAIADLQHFMTDDEIHMQLEQDTPQNALKYIRNRLNQKIKHSLEPMYEIDLDASPYFIHGMGYNLPKFLSIVETGILTQQDADKQSVEQDRLAHSSEYTTISAFDGTVDPNSKVYRAWGVDGIVFVVDKNLHGKELLDKKRFHEKYTESDRDKFDEFQLQTESVHPSAIVGVMIPERRKDIELSQLPSASIGEKIRYLRNNPDQVTIDYDDPSIYEDPVKSQNKMTELANEVSGGERLTLQEFIEKYAPSHWEIGYTPQPTMTLEQWKEQRQMSPQDTTDRK